MRRLIASFALLVLLAGTFAPLASAMPMPMQGVGAHCARKPLAKQADPTPQCHHHHGASSVAQVESVPTDQVVDSSQCCCDHECCRSLARAQWAQVPDSARTQSQQPVVQLASTSRSPRHSLDLTLYRSVRAPPVL